MDILVPGLRMPTPTPVVITKRKKLSLRDEYKILSKWSYVTTVQDGMRLASRVAMLRLSVRCAGCGKHMIAREQYQYDHEIARAISSDDGVANLRPYCVTRKTPAGMISVGCHNLKTARDKAIIAKGARIRGEKGRRNPNRKPRKKIAQRKKPWGDGARKIPSRPFAKRNKP